MKASMALDLDRGNRLEVPWLSGKVAELGRQLGIPTPTHSMIYAMLKPYMRWARRPEASYSAFSQTLISLAATLACCSNLPMVKKPWNWPAKCR